MGVPDEVKLTEHRPSSVTLLYHPYLLVGVRVLLEFLPYLHLPYPDGL